MTNNLTKWKIIDDIICFPTQNNSWESNLTNKNINGLKGEETFLNSHYFILCLDCHCHHLFVFVLIIGYEPFFFFLRFSSIVLRTKRPKATTWTYLPRRFQLSNTRMFTFVDIQRVHGGRYCHWGSWATIVNRGTFFHNWRSFFLFLCTVSGEPCILSY